MGKSKSKNIGISSQLLQAVSTRDLAKARSLIADGADVNVRSYAGTALSIAVDQGDAEAVALLLEAGADPGSGSVLTTPIRSALKNGFIEIALKLLKAGVNVEKDRERGDLFLEAIRQSKLPLVRAMIASGAEINARREGLNGQTALTVAARKAEPPIVLALLEAGADPMVRDDTGRTPAEWAESMDRGEIATILREAMTGAAPQLDHGTELLIAADRGELEKVKSLLKAGADVETRDTRERTKGCTPLLVAASVGHAPVVEALLDAGAEIEAVDNAADGQHVWRRPALVRAARAGALEVVRLLLARGARIESKDRRGSTALLLACESRHPEVAAELIRAGADVNARDDRKDTPLLYACDAGNDEVARLLLERGAKTNVKGSRIMYPLSIAAAIPKPSLVKVLLEAGADVNGRAENQGTVIHELLRLTHLLIRKGGGRIRGEPAQVVEIVKMLIAAGADLTRKDYKNTPLEIAQQMLKTYPWFDQCITLIEEGLRNPVPVKPKSRKPRTATKDEDKPQTPTSRPRKREKVTYKRPDFTKAAQSADYEAAVTELESLCGTRRQPIKHLPGGYTLHVDSRKQFSLEAAHEQFLSRGFYLFAPDAGEKDLVAILPTANREDVIASMGTGSGNHGISTGHVLAFLRNMEKTRPIVLTGIGHNFLSGLFRTAVIDPEKLADELYDICPDIVDQGHESVEALAAHLRSERAVFMWWD